MEEGMEDLSNYNSWGNSAMGSAYDAYETASECLNSLMKLGSTKIEAQKKTTYIEHKMSENRAAVTIQSFYRGYRVRRFMQYNLLIEPLEDIGVNYRDMAMSSKYDEDLYEEIISQEDEKEDELLWEGTTEQENEVYYTVSTVSQNKKNMKGCLKEGYNEDLIRSQELNTEHDPASINKKDDYCTLNRKMDLENHAAIVIQAFYRGLNVRKKYLEQKQAVITLQSLWRGYKVRQINVSGNDNIHENTETNKAMSFGVALDIKDGELNNTSEIPQIFQETRKIEERGPSRHVFSYRSNNPDISENDVQIQNLTHIMDFPECLCGNFSYDVEFPSNNTLLQWDTTFTNEHPAGEHGIKRRKTRDQLQKERQSATLIQSSWRSYQVRKELKEMGKAASKIKAFFRGYKIRQELQLHDADSSNGFLMFSLYHNDMGFDKYQAQLMNTRLKMRHNMNEPTHKSSHQHSSYEASKTFSQQIDFPSKHLIGPAFVKKAYKTRAQHQENRFAATQIQAAWRAYQVRKVIRGEHVAATKIQTYYRGYKIRMQFQLRELLSFGKYQVTEAAGDAETHSSFPDEKASLFSGIKSAPVSTVQSINVNAGIKSVQTYRVPPISIRVTSPHAVVQGYCK